MPSRQPKGDYVRGTGDWFQHKRGRASALVSITDAKTPAIGLFNNDQGGRVCHILGVTIATEFEPATSGLYLSGAYYSSGALTAIGAPDATVIAPTEAFFDTDGVPNVVAQTGTITPPTDGNALVIPFVISPYAIDGAPNITLLTGSATYAPDGGVAAFKPGRGYYLYPGLIAVAFYQVGFDFVLLPD